MTWGKAGAVRQNAMDGLAIGVSFACIVHCLALPALIATLPAWSAWLDLPEAFHIWILAFALPFSLAVLLRAARKRWWFGPLWLGVAGLTLMCLGLVAGDHHLETIATSLGGALLAAAHVMNWRQRSHRYG
jgi:hypothetical protein